MEVYVSEGLYRSNVWRKYMSEQPYEFQYAQNYVFGLDHKFTVEYARESWVSMGNPVVSFPLKIIVHVWPHQSSLYELQEYSVLDEHYYAIHTEMTLLSMVRWLTYHGYNDAMSNMIFETCRNHE